MSWPDQDRSFAWASSKRCNVVSMQQQTMLADMHMPLYTNKMRTTTNVVVQRNAEANQHAY